MSDALTDPEIRDILTTGKKIAVIGLSPVASRPSYGVTRYMISHGYEIYGIRPASPPSILDRPAYDSLEQLQADVDIFDVFRNPEAVPEVVGEIAKWIELHPRKEPRTLWLQEGVGHAEAERTAAKLGLKVVSDRCILKEHARLL